MAEGDITALLLALRDGEREVLGELLPLVYDELRAVARRRLGGRDGGTLSATALVHEVYLKLFDRTRLDLQDRHHFFAVAALAMRQVVIDHARRRRAAKRGGDARPVDIDAVQIAFDDRAEEILSLDEALRRLEGVDRRLARVVELRFFAGLSVEETAEVLEVDPRTVKRDWRKARAVLHRALEGGAT